MDEGATCFCARREFACSYVLQAFDDCLELVHFEGRGIQSFQTRCGQRSE